MAVLTRIEARKLEDISSFPIKPPTFNHVAPHVARGKGMLLLHHLCLLPVIEQKLDYIHRNRVSGVWRLVDDCTEYAHSSAAYYELEQPIRFPVLDYRDV